ncbi:MAG: beta-galactosidase [Chthoniobacteraceae bacterium]|jgi:beta-galactosidase
MKQPRFSLSQAGIAPLFGRFGNLISMNSLPRTRRRFATFIGLGFSLLFFPLNSPPALANSEIFPPEPAAQNAINWKDGYFYIDGQPTFLTSGEMHYARIPRELWRDRIWRSKQMGFNCMQMYVFWNASEGKEGQWNFTDNLDLDAWLSLLQKMGMYAVVRVGPYSCAEWEHGGFPAWLTVKPGMTLRDNDPAFLAYADPHLAQVEKIVAKHQINHGGNVLMVQLENEHSAGWGTDDNDPYLKHLVDQARVNGLEIPLFLSGLHHGGDPSGEGPYQPGSSPWYTTEFWTGWIGRYGDMDPGMLDEKIRGTWKIIAFGGAGYDYYMVHGGTNFGYSGDSFQTTYDYSAPIGETGQFHNFYYPARRAAYFAQSFSSLLTGSHDDPALARSDLPGLRVTTRTNPTLGSIVFIDNFQKKVDVQNLPEISPVASAYQAPAADKSGVVSTRISVGGVTLPHNGSLKVNPHEPCTVLVNIPWTSNATFESVCSNVIMRTTLGGVDYWVCYGAAGDTGEVTLKRKAGGPPSAQVDFTYPADDSVKEVDFNSGDGRHAKFLVMNTGLTNKTWLAHGKLYVGPSFVLEDSGMEFPPEGGTATIYSGGRKSEVSQPAISVPPLPQLPSWSWRDAAPERFPDFSTAGWAQSSGPQPMPAYDSFQNRYGWYRTTLHSDSAGPVSLHFSGQSGAFAVFLNGQPASFDHLDVKAGDNTLAILGKIDPRPKLFNFTGAIGTQAYRGLWGQVSANGAPSPLSQATWRFHGGLDDLDETAIIGRVTDWSQFLAHSPWQAGDPGAANLPTFWKSKFTYNHAAGMRETIGLTTDGLRAGHVWLNGHNLGECPENEPLYMPECWLKDGTNDLVIFDLYGSKPNQVRLTRYQAFSVASSR